MQGPPWPGLTFVVNDDAGPGHGEHLGFEQVKIAGGRRLKEGAEIARILLSPSGPNPQVQMHGYPAFDIAFGERWLSAYALLEVYAWVRAFVETFASDFD